MIRIDPRYLEHARAMKRGEGILAHHPADYPAPHCAVEGCAVEGDHHHLRDDLHPHGPQAWVHRPGVDADELALCPGCERAPGVIHFHDAYRNTVTLGAVHASMTGQPHPFLP